VFQAKQQWSTMSAEDLKTRLASQLSRMDCQMFSTGFNLGERGGKGRGLGGTSGEACADGGRSALQDTGAQHSTRRCAARAHARSHRYQPGSSPQKGDLNQPSKVLQCI
jgi:hypothetical protein